MFVEQFFPLITLAAVGAFTPGPNNILLMNTGLNFGIRRGIPLALGVVFGFITFLFISLLGLSYLVERVLVLKSVIRIVGSLYLLYLAYKLFPLSKNNTGSKSAASTYTNSENKSKIGFFNAFVFQIMNPKGVTMLLILPSVVPVDTILEKGVFMFITFWTTAASAFTWLFGGKLLQTFVNNPQRMYVMNVISSLLLVVTVVILYI